MLQQSRAFVDSAPVSAMSYFQTKDFVRALQDVVFRGAANKRQYEKVKKVLANLSSATPFHGLPTTKNGESRIKHCVKYDLGDGWRLITRQDNRTCTFLYLGNHADCDRWLKTHRGEDIGIKDGRVIRLPGVSEDHAQTRSHSTILDNRSLIDLLSQDDADHVLELLPPSLVRKLYSLTGASSSDEIAALAHEIKDEAKSSFVLTVFVLLQAGNIDGAKAHVDGSRGTILAPDDVSLNDIVSVEDGDEVRRLRVGSPEYEAWLTNFEKRSSWQDWFLFLHPEQEKVVKADYPGPSQLSGVSGSGKTCVAVRRATRLAEDVNASVLLLTLNRSLAGLLQQLVDAVCVDDATRRRIRVMSLFELSRQLLNRFEPFNSDKYSDVTFKLNEHVDEIFREYYRQWTNNNNAAVLLPLHKSFNARGVNGEIYLRDEFDWIRSAVHPVDRRQYLGLERKGRKFPIPGDRRADMLKGLAGWEQKMSDVGVIDYLGLVSALSRHLDRIVPEFSNILVDEAQDFGTTELEIVRRLVKPGPNSLFLCGDIAQTVLPKHRSLASAGITEVVHDRIRQNYRNSREILTAAYELLKSNLHDEMFENDDLEILDPRFANFSGPAPIALAADSLLEEIAYARTYAETSLRLGSKTICIAFAGFSARDIALFAAECGVTALNGAYDPSTDRLVFSDLEQTKGYEFDTLIIIGCSEGVLPANDTPPEEAFRETCKLYVAMTRAKRELILSFSGVASPWIRAVSDTIATDTWSLYETLNPALVGEVPKCLPELEPDAGTEDLRMLTGLQFVYTSHACGLSPEAQDKLIDLVDGKGARRGGPNGRRTRWINIGSLASDLRDSGKYDNDFGPKAAAELRLTLPG